MLKLRSGRGFSLIELMVAVSIAGVLLAMALPAFSGWLVNSRIRAAATDFYTGLQQAKTEAITRNTQVRFSSVTSVTAGCALSNNGTYWIINVVNGTNDVGGKCNVVADFTTAPLIIAKRAVDPNTTVLVSSSNNVLAFTNLGRVTLQPAVSPVPVPAANITYDFTATSNGGCAAAGGNLTCLRVIVSPAGQVRMCNPRYPAGDPQACN